MPIRELFSETPIIPIVAINNEDDAEHLARALVAAGMKNIEVSIRCDNSYLAMKRIKQAVPSATVGAGNIIEVGQIEKALAHGAKFLVSPGITPDIAGAAKECAVPFLPGAMSPSDIMMAKDYGFSTVKYCPAEAMGGVETLKILTNIFPRMHFCPSGGINSSNMLHYVLLDNVISVAGTWVAPHERINTKDWKFITALAKKALTLIED